MEDQHPLGRATLWHGDDSPIAARLDGARERIDLAAPRLAMHLLTWDDALTRAVDRGVAVRLLSAEEPASRRDAEELIAEWRQHFEVLARPSVALRSYGGEGSLSMLRVDEKIFAPVGVRTGVRGASVIAVVGRGSDTGMAFDLMVAEFEEQWASSFALSLSDESGAWAHVQREAQRVRESPDPQAFEALAVMALRYTPGLDPLVEADTSSSPDHGADVVAWNSGLQGLGQELGNPFVVQVKCHRRPLPAALVDQVAAQARAVGASSAIVFANQPFTASARERVAQLRTDRAVNVLLLTPDDLLAAASGTEAFARLLAAPDDDRESPD